MALQWTPSFLAAHGASSLQGELAGRRLCVARRSTSRARACRPARADLHSSKRLDSNGAGLLFKEEKEEETRGLLGAVGGLPSGAIRSGRPEQGVHVAVDIRAAKKGSPPIMPAVMTRSGPADLSTVLLRNRIVFVGSPVNSQVAQRVISQLMTLEAIDENEEIKMYINCPGGSTYSVLAIYDCMSWIKPKVSTVCFGIAASQGALLLAGGEKGRRFAMPNARIMIHQPQGGCGGTADDVRRQVNEVMQSRDKIDKMYAAFTGQPLGRVQNFTDRDRFFSAAEAMEIGLIDGLLETEY